LAFPETSREPTTLVVERVVVPLTLAFPETSRAPTTLVLARVVVPLTLAFPETSRGPTTLVVARVVVPVALRLLSSVSPPTLRFPERSRLSSKNVPVCKTSIYAVLSVVCPSTLRFPDTSMSTCLKLNTSTQMCIAEKNSSSCKGDNVKLNPKTKKCERPVCDKDSKLKNNKCEKNITTCGDGFKLNTKTYKCDIKICEPGYSFNSKSKKCEKNVKSCESGLKLDTKTQMCIAEKTSSSCTGINVKLNPKTKKCERPICDYGGKLENNKCTNCNNIQDKSGNTCLHYYVTNVHKLNNITKFYG
jgi:hypothetical protein